MNAAARSPLGEASAAALQAWQPVAPADPFGDAPRADVPGLGPDTVWLDVESSLSLLLTDIGSCRGGCHRYVGFIGSVGCFDGRWWWWCAAAELCGTYPEETERDARAKVAEACRLLQERIPR